MEGIRIGDIEVYPNDLETTEEYYGRGSKKTEFDWMDAGVKCTGLGDGWRLPTDHEIYYLCKIHDIYKILDLRRFSYWTNVIDNNGNAKVLFRPTDIKAKDNEFVWWHLGSLVGVRPVRSIYT